MTAAVAIETAITGDLVVAGWGLGELTFDAVPHRYMVRWRELDSVTKIMRACSLGFTGFAPEEALARGNYAHEASVLIDDDALDWSQVPERWAGYCRAYERAIRETRSRAAAAERRMYHPQFWYAGTLDRVVIREGRRIGVELKTGSTTDVSVQSAGYDRLWRFWWPNRPIAAWECWKLNEDGSYRIHELDVEEGWQDFASCLRIMARRRQPVTRL